MTRPVGMPAGPASPNRSGRFSFVDLVFSTVPPDQRVHCPAVSSYRSTAQCALSGIEQTRAHGRFMEWCDKKWDFCGELRRDRSLMAELAEPGSTGCRSAAELRIVVLCFPSCRH